MKTKSMLRQQMLGQRLSRVTITVSSSLDVVRLLIETFYLLCIWEIHKCDPLWLEMEARIPNSVRNRFLGPCGRCQMIFNCTSESHLLPLNLPKKHNSAICAQVLSRVLLVYLAQFQNVQSISSKFAAKLEKGKILDFKILLPRNNVLLA